MYYSRSIVRYLHNISDARAATNFACCCYSLVQSVWQAVLITVFLALMVPAPAFTATPVEGGTASVLSLENAVAIAIEGNPGLAEMRSRAEAMAAIPLQAGALPDPMVSLNALNFPTDSFDRDQEAMTQLQIGIEQSLPFPGKLGLKERAAEFEADAVASNVDETQLRLMHKVKQAWWQIVYLDRALEIVSRNQDLLRQRLCQRPPSTIERPVQLRH